MDRKIMLFHRSSAEHKNLLKSSNRFFRFHKIALYFKLTEFNGKNNAQAKISLK